MRSASINFLCALICVALLAALVGIQPAYAASFSVSNAAELISAINTANANTGDDIITLAADIVLTVVDNTTGGLNGLPIIASDGGHSLTIEGNSHTISRSGAAPRFRFLYVSSGANLTLNNLTLSNGYGPDGTDSSTPPGGGAIYILNGATVNLNSTTITGNKTGNGVVLTSGGTQDGGFGGGIYNIGTLNITNSTISNNTTGNGAFVSSGGGTGWGGSGGGIYNVGTLTITDSTISGNITGNGGAGTTFITHGGIGGGVHSEFGTLTIRGSTISNNKTGNGGTNNGTGRADGGIGGGIAVNNQSSANIVNSTITGNTTGNGGSGSGGAYGGDGAGLYLFSITNAQLINLTISSNTTGTGWSGSGSGAGIMNDNFAIVTIKNTLAANNANSVECAGNAFNTSANNMTDDSSCGSGFTQQTSAQINLGALASNGGPTQTAALGLGSTAIDAGDDTTCAGALVNSIDQRGVTRPQGSHCDIGAFEFDITVPTVLSTTPADGATVNPGPSQITVTFSEDVLHDGSVNSADNIANYHLIQKGPNNVYDGTACNDGVFPIGDDTAISIDGVSYNDTTHVATLLVNGGAALPVGEYRLFVCGTASIHDIAGNTLYGGDFDAVETFTVGLTASALPSTGFAQGHISILSSQPASKQYSPTNLILEIPSLKVKTPIVGVPQSGNTWDVTWLGNDAGWLNGSAFPTWSGNTVITGHVWNADNTPGIFVNLKQLKYGDHFLIHAFGQIYTYEVRENRWLLPSNSFKTVFKHEEQDWVTLLTCELYNPFGDDYLFRRMVRALLISFQ